MKNSMLRIELEAAFDCADDVSVLVEAAQDVFNATEADFTRMKEKTWYKRIWGMITFSKENQKVVANGVTSLAKMQDILAKVLLILSEKSRDAASIVEEHADEILQLSENQLFIAKKLKEISDQRKFGYEAVSDIRDLDPAKKFALLSALAYIGQGFDSLETSRRSQDFFASITRYIRSRDFTSDFNPEMTGHLDKSEAQALYRLMMEYVYCVTGQFEYTPEMGVVAESLAVSKKAQAETLAGIQTYAQLVGGDNVQDWYGADEYGEADLYYFDAEALELEPYEAAGADQIPDLFPDDTAEGYPQIRAVITRNFQELAGSSRAKATADREKIKNFIEKNGLPVEVDTAAGLVEFGEIKVKATIKGYKAGLLLTAAGLHYLDRAGELTSIFYKDIKAISIDFFSEEDKALNIELVDGQTVTIRDRRLQESVLLDILSEAAALAKAGLVPRKDYPVSLREMPWEVQFAYCKLLVKVESRGENKDYGEIFNYACSLNLDPQQRAWLLNFMEDPNQSVEKILLEIEREVPYASKQSLRLALIQDLAALIYTSHQTITDQQWTAMKEIARRYQISTKLLECLIPFGQIEAKIVDGSITQEEIQRLSGSVASALEENQLSLASVLAAKTRGIPLYLSFLPMALVLPQALLLAGLGALGGKLILGRLAKKSFIEKRLAVIADELDNYKQSLEKARRHQALARRGEAKDKEHVADKICNSLQNRIETLTGYQTEIGAALQKSPAEVAQKELTKVWEQGKKYAEGLKFGFGEKTKS